MRFHDHFTGKRLAWADKWVATGELPWFIPRPSVIERMKALASDEELYYVQPDGTWKKGGDGRSKGLKKSELPKGAKMSTEEASSKDSQKEALEKELKKATSAHNKAIANYRRANRNGQKDLLEELDLEVSKTYEKLDKAHEAYRKFLSLTPMEYQRYLAGVSVQASVETAKWKKKKRIDQAQIEYDTRVSLTAVAGTVVQEVVEMLRKNGAIDGPLKYNASLLFTLTAKAIALYNATPLFRKNLMEGGRQFLHAQMREWASEYLRKKDKERYNALPQQWSNIPAELAAPKDKKWHIRDGAQDDKIVYSADDKTLVVGMTDKLNRRNFKDKGPLGGGRYWTDDQYKLDNK